MSEGSYLTIRALLGGLPITEEQDMACRFLESKGLRFCIDFGYENAIKMVGEYPDWHEPHRC
jgi:hypothetical protein